MATELTKPFTYDAANTRLFRLFKLDLNGEDQPLQGKLLSLTFHGTLQDQYKTFLKIHVWEQTLDVMRALSGSDDYIALSYCWGDQSERYPLWLVTVANHLDKRGEPIVEPEPDRSGIIWITASLRSFLLEMRRQKLNSFLWIDAICIDQGSLTDKDVQIPRMKDVYETAASVYVWLGEASDEELKCLDRLTEIAKAKKEAGTTYGVTRLESAIFLSTVDLFTGPDLFWETMSRLLSLPWWRRLWTLQELVVAAKATTAGKDDSRPYQPPSPNAKILCGSAHVDWQHLEDVVESIELTQLGIWLGNRQFGNSSLPTNGLLGILEIRMCRESLTTNGWAVSPGTLLLTTRTRQATRAQDMVLGMLAMLDRRTIRKLDLSASMPAEEVFIRFAKYYIHEEPRECLLNHTATESKLPGLPSWCLDFSSPPETTSIGTRPPNVEDLEQLHQYPCAGFQREGRWAIPQRRFEFGRLVINVFSARDANHGLYNTSNQRSVRSVEGTNCIRTSGVSIDVVTDMIPYSSTAESADFLKLDGVQACQTLAWDKQCLDLARRTLPPGTSAYGLHARTISASKATATTSYITTFSYDRDERIDFASRYFRFRLYMQAAQRSDENAAANLEQDVADFALCVQQMSRRRCFFATRCGRIGLGPSNMQVGGELVVLFFCPTPYLLRKTQQSTTFVGEAYVHGLMYGEALEMLDRGELKETQWIIE